MNFELVFSSEIDKYATSTVCMFRIVNLEQINKEAGRETGNDIIREVSKFVRESISTEWIKRYTNIPFCWFLGKSIIF